MQETNKSKSSTAWRLFYGSLAVVAIFWIAALVVGIQGGDGARAKGALIGELFGVVSCLFIGMAFIGAGAAAYLQREQLNEQRRQILHTAASERKAGVERRFFQLLGSWQAMSNNISFSEKVNEGTLSYGGRQAVIKLFERLEANQKDDRQNYAQGTIIDDIQRHQDIQNAYRLFYDGKIVEGRKVSPASGYAIGNYFRLLYHILRYIRENAEDDRQRTFYRRIVRAHLSSPELILLLYNGLGTWGYPKMFLEMREAGVLHNLQESSLPDADDVRLYTTLKPPFPDDWK